jgi:hypothetical protein
MFIVGAFAVLAYTLGLRVPSELFKQATKEKFVVHSHQIQYGLIRRKGKQQLHTLSRVCVCKLDHLMYTHNLFGVICDLRPKGLLLRESASTRMRQFVSLLSAIGIQDADNIPVIAFAVVQP